MSKPQIIAFYLPQFHPTPQNDEWWGKGFTEWTNVAKAQPLFKGHYQPKIPSDLGFYDLRLPESRILQAEYAQKAGISAFCYWHYWFNGKELLNTPFDEVVETGKPNFPFCLAWANHPWHKKAWSTNNSVVSERSRVLIDQTYGGEEDYKNHFYKLLPAFKDKRYFKVNGKLLFMVYAPWDFKDFPSFKRIWNELAEKEGVPQFSFITHIYDLFRIMDIDTYLAMGYDAINLSLHRNPFKSERKVNVKSLWGKIKYHVTHSIMIKPEIVEYKEAIKWMNSDLFENEKIYPTIVPNWDHTPRSGRFGRVFHNCTPELWRKHIISILKRIKNKSPENQIIFLKSWNEWGEGNYIEPDLKYGTQHLDILKEELEKWESN